MTQTAVEWLLEEFANKGHIGLHEKLQAKEMERQQIIDAFESGEANEYKITRFQGYYPTTPETYYATEYDQTY